MPVKIKKKIVPSYYKHVRYDVLPLLPQLDGGRFFEVGCGAGDTLAFLKTSGRCSWAGGVELFHSAVEDARTKNIDLVLEGNVSEMTLPFEHGSLDVILCLDVLEHLNDPWKVLQELSKYLKSGGIFICSIPNVRNFRVTMPLIIRGIWEYSNEGILDKTHLRFFTKKSAIALVECSGCRVDKVKATGLEQGSKAYVVNLLTFNMFRPYFEFQYLIRGVK